MEFVLQEEIKINFCQTYVIQVEPNERDRVRRWASAQIDTDLIGAYGEIFLENKYRLKTTSNVNPKTFPYIGVTNVTSS